LNIGHEMIAGKSVDPMPISQLAMWLFLASEAMFFIVMLGSFVVLESATDQHRVFVQSSAILSRGIGIGCVVLLGLSSVGLMGKKILVKRAAILLACGYLLLSGWQWKILGAHQLHSSTNNFFACFYLLSAVHCVHLLAGIFALSWLLHRRRSLAVIQIYWHFVNVMGVLSIVVLYFV
jgi:heme/copper-type cytochrome/quinol oxidase subunit 3